LSEKAWVKEVVLVTGMLETVKRRVKDVTSAREAAAALGMGL
jgi:hypothetical protein